MSALLGLCLALSLSVSTLAKGPSTSTNHGKLKIKNLVTFGDSYTDTFTPADAGLSWPTYAVEDSGVTLYPYARSGATCSNLITPRPFPSLFESQLPDYFAEVANGTVVLNPKDTLYSQWIGTNDLGSKSLIIGANTGDLVQVTECMVNWVQVLYESGARNFLFQNMIPLGLTKLYQADSYPNLYYYMDRNTTEWNLFMTEMVLAGNKLTQLMLKDLASSLHGAHIGIFDSHSLFQDMHDNPSEYLNGTAPLNVTAPLHACVYAIANATAPVCTTAVGTDRDSYLWYDELHPSEQADRMVGREIAKVINGTSKWVNWLS